MVRDIGSWRMLSTLLLDVSLSLRTWICFRCRGKMSLYIVVFCGLGDVFFPAGLCNPSKTTLTWVPRIKSPKEQGHSMLVYRVSLRILRWYTIIGGARGHFPVCLRTV